MGGQPTFISRVTEGSAATASILMTIITRIIFCVIERCVYASATDTVATASVAVAYAVTVGVYFLFGSMFQHNKANERS